ncbi:MAG: type II toxin-antitoxin system VapC family toxin [Firmicutes bacterium]|nr:type II toxin-antitoxin system VapC family toxin [Bacillota bacterium]
MRYLLDTHALIWYFENSSELLQKIKELIKRPENDLYVYAMSLWEIAIKVNLGKLNLSFTFDKLIEDVRKRDFDILQIEDEYLRGLSSLPFIQKDPFDRLLISTALAENLTIITIDDNIQKYDVSWIW